jgi:hypothetical protein
MLRAIDKALPKLSEQRRKEVDGVAERQELTPRVMFRLTGFHHDGGGGLLREESVERRP